MALWQTAAILSAIILGLTACNTSDALTPQVDVGTGSAAASTPVSQADTDTIARQPSQPAWNNAGGQPAPAYGAQNTLQAQADGLARGNSPASSGPPPQFPGNEQQQAAAAAQQQPAPEAPAPQESASLPQASSAGSIRFLPIIGAPVQAVTPLSRQLGAEARSRGLTIRSSSDNGAGTILKGYFSAFSDGGKVTVVYVWDVLDAAGNRLHRIQGQDTVAGSAAEPWAAVPPSLMQTIATKTMEQFVSWRDSQPG